MLIFQVRRYLSRTGMPRTVFGRRVVNDPRFVDDLARGRQPRPETVARVEAYIAAHPDGPR